MAWTGDEWEKASVLKNQVGGVPGMSYALTDEGEVLVDAPARRGGEQRVDYRAELAPLSGEARRQRAVELLRRDGWPLR